MFLKFILPSCVSITPEKCGLDGLLPFAFHAPGESGLIHVPKRLVHILLWRFAFKRITPDLQLLWLSRSRLTLASVSAPAHRLSLSFTASKGGHRHVMDIGLWLLKHFPGRYVPTIASLEISLH
jgi:hypothetical protein